MYQLSHLCYTEWTHHRCDCSDQLPSSHTPLDSHVGSPHNQCTVSQPAGSALGFGLNSGRRGQNIFSTGAISSTKSVTPGSPSCYPVHTKSI